MVENRFYFLQVAVHFGFQTINTKKLHCARQILSILNANPIFAISKLTIRIFTIAKNINLDSEVSLSH